MIWKEKWVSGQELQRIKKLNRREFLDRMRSNEKLAGTLATLEVQVGRSYLGDYLDRIAEVTPEDIRDAARKYLKSENRTSIYVIPGGEPDQQPEAYTEIRSLGISASSRLVAAPDTFKNNSIYPTPDGWKHPLSFSRQPQKITYPKPNIARINDTPVFFLPDRELPLIDLTLMVKAGEVDINKDKTGLAGILSDIMLRGGTLHYSPSELAREIDQNAIRISVSIGEEASSIHLSVMKADWEKGLELLEEILVRPAFDEKVLEVIKDQAIAALNRQADQAQAVAMREGMIWHFEGHPYGRDPLLGLKTIPGITSDDLTEFLKTYFVPGNMVAAVSGDTDLEEITTGVKKLLAALPQSKAPERDLGEPAENKPLLAVIDKPGQVQSQVVFMLQGFERTNPAFWKSRLLIDIFGGSDSLMYTRLRDDLGLVYSAGFFQTYKWNAGVLMGYIGCRGDRTVTSIEETMNIMNSLRNSVPKRDFKLKRLDALNSFVFNVDTPAELVEVYSSYYMRGEPLETLEKIQDAYLQATRDELRDIAVELLEPDKLQVFIVADKKTPVKKGDGTVATLEEDLKSLAERIGIPYREIPLR
jgi:zinc protease